jgi:hypothetical protein
VYLRYQLAKALQEERLRMAARNHRAAEARRARTACPGHAAVTKDGSTARDAAKTPGKQGATAGPGIPLGAILLFPRGMVPAVLKLARARGRIWPLRKSLNPGLLAHLPDQCAAEGLALLGLAARKRPGAPGPGVLVQQQDLVILDEDSGNPNIHSQNLPRDGSR